MEFKAMTLSQCAEFDKQTGAKYKMTAWSRICIARSGENSRSQIRKRNQRERKAVKGRK